MKLPLYYLLFVRNQARILGRRAQRSGLHERARQYRFKEDWAKDQLQKIVGSFEDYLRVERG